jgi:hypothetical protein
MDLSEAVEKAHRILLEEQTKSTLQYKYAKETGLTRGMTNESLLNLAAHVTLTSNRQRRPRDVYEDPKLYKFESVNFDLLLKIFHQVMETERPQFVGALLKLVEKPFSAQPATTGSFPSVDGNSSMLPLIAEFCVRTGHLNELLKATKKPKFPTSSLAMMVMELEEMIALNFNLFSDSQLETMPKELATLRENSALQTYSSKAERGKAQVKNAHYTPGFERMGRAVVAGIDGLTEECRKARYFYLKGALQELPNLEIESDKVKVVGYLDSLGFNPVLGASLARAEQQYSSASGPFDWKECLGHIRSFYEHMNIDAGQAIAKSMGKPVLDEWDPTLTFLKNSKFFTEQQDKFARGLYTLLSDEGVHPLIAEKEFARLLRNMVIEYGLMFLTMLEKNGIRI